MTTIYGFFDNPFGVGDAQAVALTEDGTVVATHICSTEFFAEQDLGMDGISQRKHDIYNRCFPNGWRTQFIHRNESNVPQGFKDAFDKYKQTNNAALRLTAPLHPPRIVSAAMTLQYQHPNGGVVDVIITSPRHWDEVCVGVVKKLIGEERWRVLSETQGFVDTRCRFLTRQEAWPVAEVNGQIIRRVGGDGPSGHGLFSENLY